MAMTTWNPKKHKRMRKHGFLHRMASFKGRLMIKRRRTKGRALLSVAKKVRAVK